MKSFKLPPKHTLVMEEIRSYIMNSGLQTGERLPTEMELAEKLGVSRGTVREALKALQTLGIVETVHGSGMFLKEFSINTILENIPYGVVVNETELMELLEIRMALEVSFIKQVVRIISKDTLNALRDILKRMKECVDRGDREGYAREDFLFHQMLYKDLGNRLLVRLISTFVQLLESTQNQELTLEPDLEASDLGHFELMKAIEKREPELAAIKRMDSFRFFENRVRQKRLATFV